MSRDSVVCKIPGSISVVNTLWRLGLGILQDSAYVSVHSEHLSWGARLCVPYFGAPGWGHTYRGLGCRTWVLRGFKESNRQAVWTQTRTPKRARQGLSAPPGHCWGPRGGRPCGFLGHGLGDTSLSPTPTPGPSRWRPEQQGRWAPSGQRIQGLRQAY